MIFWLVLSLTAGASLHVGSFPSLQACQAAAKAIWAYESNGTSTAYGAACVQANTGRNGEPPAPH